MSTIGNGSNGNDRRELLERRAALVRARIEERLQVLEHRRDGLVHRVQNLTKPPLSIVAFAVVGLAGAALLVQRARQRRRRSLELFGRRAPRRGWFARTLEKAAVSVGAAALHRLGTWGLDSLARPAPRAPRSLPAPPRPTVSRLPGA